MKEIRRSRRLRLPRRRYQFTKPIISDDDDDDDELDFKHKISIVQTNKNVNRVATTNLIPQKQELSSSVLYSIDSKEKLSSISDDLTTLTIRTTNTTPLTSLTYSNTKQTDFEIIKIDLSNTDTFDSSSSSDYDQSLSLNRKYSLSNMNQKLNNINNLSSIDETDISMKSIVFSQHNSLEQNLYYQKHLSCIHIPGISNENPPIISSSVPINTTQQSSLIQWNLPKMTTNLKILIGCSSFSLIAGIVLLFIIL